MRASISPSSLSTENIAQNGVWSTQVSTIISWFNIALTPKTFSFIIPNFLYYLKVSKWTLWNIFSHLLLKTSLWTIIAVSIHFLENESEEKGTEGILY